MARESRSKDKDKDVKPQGAATGNGSTTSLTVTLSNPLGKKRKRSSTSATAQAHDPPAGATEDVAALAAGDRLLGTETRKAIILVLESMRQAMPANTPARDILTLTLPPASEASPHSDLSRLLQEPSLSRGRLESSLSVLAAQLLPPGAPSPFSSTEARSPSLSDEQSSVYAMFKAVHRTLTSLHPTTSHTATQPSAASTSIQIPVRVVDKAPVTDAFALQQRLPGSGGHAEWFTSAVEPSQVKSLIQFRQSSQSPQKSPVKTEEVKREESGLAQILASSENIFGQATPVSVHPTTHQTASSSSERTLADSVYQRASQNVEKIKAMRAVRRKRLFGAVTHAVDFSSHSRESWQPSFGMTHDSTAASGGWGYISSWNMGYRNGDWRDRNAQHWGARVGTESYSGERGLGATVEDVEMGDPEEVATLLAANERRMRELSEWQQVRVRRGDPRWLPPREASVAVEVLETLTTLAAKTAPSKLVPAGETASTIAGKVIHTSAPHIRGLLDPRRPRAVIDDATLKLIPRSANILPTSQRPPPRYPADGSQPRPATPMQYTGARPAGTPYGQAPPRPSGQQPTSAGGQQYNPYNRPAAPYASTPHRPGQPYTPQPYGRPNTPLVTPVVPRTTGPIGTPSHYQPPR